jgi:hypothetical protein
MNKEKLQGIKEELLNELESHKANMYRTQGALNIIEELLKEE